MGKRSLILLCIVAVVALGFGAFHYFTSSSAPSAAGVQSSKVRQIVNPDGDCKLRTVTTAGEPIEFTASCRRTDGAILAQVEGCSPMTFVRQNNALNGIYACPDCEAANSQDYAACPLSGADRGADWAVINE